MSDWFFRSRLMVAWSAGESPAKATTVPYVHSMCCAQSVRIAECRAVTALASVEYVPRECMDEVLGWSPPCASLGPQATSAPPESASVATTAAADRLGVRVMVLMARPSGGGTVVPDVRRPDRSLTC